jgi:hypothetical protein
MANFKLKFSSTQDLAVANAAMKTLNQRMVGPGLNPMTTQRARDLIAGWYLGGRLDQDPNFIPALSYFSSPPTQADKDLYHKVTEPFCQTCHAAQNVSELPDQIKVCGGSSFLDQNHVMTNSLVPFERFWLDSTTLIPLMGLSCTARPARHPFL